MTALEEIEAAIEKLNVIRADCGMVTLGHDPEVVFFRTDDDTDAEGNRYSFGVGVDVDDEEIARGIVTLHRTIDAQLAILTHVAAHYSGDLGISTNRHVVALARAINGGTE